MDELPVFHTLRPVRMTLIDDAATCVECGGLMPPGTVIMLWPTDTCEPSRLTHDGECPRWTPTVIGGKRGARPATQRQLPFLSLVPGGAEEEL